MDTWDLFQKNEANSQKVSVMSDLTLKFAHYCPVIQTVVLVFGTLLCFAVAYARGDVSLYLPFVSETGAYSPEKCLFSLSLIIGSFLGIASCVFYFLVSKNNPLNTMRVFSYLNKGAVVVGIISMIGLAGVAAFPMTTVFWAHLVFAGVYFVGNAVYFILLSVMTLKMEAQRKIIILRVSLTIAILIFLFLLVILFPQSLVKWHQYNSSIPALKTPDKQGFTLVLLSSILEWAIVIVIVSFNLSLVVDLKNYSFQIVMSQTKTTTVAAVEGPPVSRN